MHYFILPYRRYFDFGGRSRRLEFWLFQLGFWALTIALLLVRDIVGEPLAARWGVDRETAFGWLSLPVAVLWLGSLVPGFAVAFRRLHDQGKSGWWLLWLIIGIGWVVIAVVMLLKGDDYENEYGPDPRNAAAAISADIFA